MKSRIAMVIFSVFIALSSFALSGCENLQDDSSQQGNSSIESTTDVSSADEAQTENESEITNEIALKFKWPFNDPIDFSNAVVHGRDGEIPISDMSEDNWLYVICDYVYLAEPQGVSYNSIDDADIFNEAELTFEGAPETVSHNYRKYKAGDTFEGLTLVSATTSFNPAASTTGYFDGGTALFEGKITLSGFCRIAPESDGYTYEGDIQLVLDKNSCQLPIINYTLDENGQEPVSVGRNGDFVRCDEYDIPIILGNAYNDYPELDFSDFPDDGSFVRVNVTVDRVYVRNEMTLTRSVTCNIVDIEVIDN